MVHRHHLRDFNSSATSAFDPLGLKNGADFTSKVWVGITLMHGRSRPPTLWIKLKHEAAREKNFVFQTFQKGHKALWACLCFIASQNGT